MRRRSRLGANSFTTVRRVILPLMGPAILAALTYSFVRAITSVSAVIFLVSAKHNMATAFIVGTGRERRVWPRDRLFGRADRHDAGRHPSSAAAGRNAPFAPHRPRSISGLKAAKSRREV